MLAGHHFSLKASMRSAGTHVGTDVPHFVDKLLAGMPITAAIIGASVAQNAGCLTQPGRRCMNYRGVDNVTLVHGIPRARPFEGFLIRWLKWVNHTWPHAGHQVVNNGRDAQPIWTLLPCLYAYVPPKVDLLFLEVGSMPYAHDPIRVEAMVRRLATLDPRPTIVFVTVTVWCTCNPLCRNFKAYGVSRLPAFKAQLLLNQTERPIPHVEKSVSAICSHYGVSCISMRSALNEPMFAGRPGFSIPEVAGDCLHPTSGTRGVDYVTDMVIHWTREAVSARRSAIADSRPMPSAGISNSSLPTPLHIRATRLYKAPSSCFNLENLGSRGVSNGQHLLTVPWHTASCPVLSESSHGLESQKWGRRRVGGTSNSGGGDDSNSKPPQTCMTGSLEACAAAHANTQKCTLWDEVHSCSGSALSTRPSVWFFCEVALSGSRKESPGVVALQPGAQLYLPLDVSFAGANAGTSIAVSLLHLTSFEGMGMAYVSCLAGCECSQERINAHRVAKAGQRNESTYKEFSFTITTQRQSQSCLLALRLSSETSSGAHKFKVRSITARAIEQCETRNAPGTCKAEVAVGNEVTLAGGPALR